MRNRKISSNLLYPGITQRNLLPSYWIFLSQQH